MTMRFPMVTATMLLLGFMLSGDIPEVAAGSSPIFVPLGSDATADIYNAGDLDRRCKQWSNGCVTCQRGQMCSNPGIACQPQQVVCLWR